MIKQGSSQECSNCNIRKSKHHNIKGLKQKRKDMIISKDEEKVLYNLNIHRIIIQKKILRKPETEEAFPNLINICQKSQSKYIINGTRLDISL